MKVYVVYCYDRHVDPGIQVHRTLAGANRAIDAFCTSYDAPSWKWHERDYGRANGWLRYVESDGDYGPNARIEEKELRE